MLHTSTSISSLTSELLALRAVLNATVDAIQRVDFGSPSFVHRSRHQQTELNELLQQLKYLHSVGLQLSARWERIPKLGDNQDAFMHLFSPELRNFLSIISITIAMMERHSGEFDQASSFERLSQDLAGLIRFLEDSPR